MQVHKDILSLRLEPCSLNPSKHNWVFGTLFIYACFTIPNIARLSVAVRFPGISRSAFNLWMKSVEGLILRRWFRNVVQDFGAFSHIFCNLQPSLAFYCLCLRRVVLLNWIALYAWTINLTRAVFKSCMCPATLSSAILKLFKINLTSITYL